MTCSGFAIEKLSGNFKEKIFKCKQKTTDNKIIKNNKTVINPGRTCCPQTNGNNPQLWDSYVRQNIFLKNKANGFTRHLLNMLPDDTAGRASAGSVPKPEGPQSMVALRPAQRHFAKFRSFQFYPSFSEVITRLIKLSILSAFSNMV